MCVCHVSVGALEFRRWCQIPRRTWVLGTKLESPTRAVKLEHWNIPPAPLLIFVRTLYLRGFWSLTMGQEALFPQDPHLMHMGFLGHCDQCILSPALDSAFRPGEATFKIQCWLVF